MTTIHRRTRIRLDFAAASDLPRAEPLPNGMLRAWGIANTRGVLQYPDEGTAELVDDETLGDPAALATLAGLTLTLDHPSIDSPGGGMVDAENYRDLAHGSLVGHRWDAAAGQLLVQVQLSSREVLDAARSGVVELSFGYEADYVAGEGVTPEGVRYTGTQRNRRYNHLAVVGLARAGRTARLRLDGAHMLHKLKIGTREFQIPGVVARGLRADALDDAARTQAKSDAIEVGSITIDGTELIVPKATIDAIVAMLAGPAPAAAAAPPMDGMTPAEQQQLPPKLDRASIERIVDERLAAHRRDSETRDVVVQAARAVLGSDADLTTDTWTLAGSALKRSGHADAQVDSLVAAARRDGASVESIEARGALRALVTTARQTEAATNGGAALVAIVRERQDAAGEQNEARTRTDGAPLDSGEARARMIERQRGIKPAPKAAG